MKLALTLVAIAGAQPTYYGAQQTYYSAPTPTPAPASVGGGEKGIPIDIGRIVDSDLVYPGAFPNVVWSGNPNPALRAVSPWDAVAAKLNTDGINDGPAPGASGVPAGVAAVLANNGLAPQPQSLNRFVVGGGNNYASYPSAYGPATSYYQPQSNFYTQPNYYPNYQPNYYQPNYYQPNYYQPNYFQPNSYSYQSSYYQPNYNAFSGYSGYSAPFQTQLTGAQLNSAAVAPATSPMASQPQYINYNAQLGQQFGFPVTQQQQANWGNWGNTAPAPVLQNTQIALNPTNVGSPIAQIPTAALNAAFPGTYGPLGGVYGR